VAAAALLLLVCVAAAHASPTVLVATKGPATLKGLEATASDFRKQMTRLQAQMKQIELRYEAASGRLDAVNGELAATRLQLSRSQTVLNQQVEVVGSRLATMYKVAGTFSFVDVLASSASLSDLQSELVFFRRISEQDKRNADGLTQLNEQVRSLEQALEKQRADATAVQAEIDEQRTAMGDKIAARRAILDALVKKIRAILAARVPTSSLSDPVPLNGSFTPLTWAKALLQQLHMPLTAENVAAITAWELAEGGHWHNTAHYNPLNTTMPEPGATSMNSVGVKAYLSWAQGFTATLATLHNGYYEGILAALRAGDDAIAVAHAVAASPWGTGNFQSLL
jgi:peptidoglycan hydrolase CwlO-like protein